MRFKRENWQPTIGDKYALVDFDGITFVWQKSQFKDITSFREYYKLCGPEPIYEEVH